MGYRERDDYDPDDPINQVGNVEANVRADIEALITTHPMGEGLSAMAIHLAHTLDHAEAMFRAALAKELRAILNDLAGMSSTGDDADLVEGLSTPTKPEGNGAEDE